MLEFDGTLQAILFLGTREIGSAKSYAWLCAESAERGKIPETGSPWHGYKLEWYVRDGDASPGIVPGDILSVRGEIQGVNRSGRADEYWHNLWVIKWSRWGSRELKLNPTEHLSHRSCQYGYDHGE